MKKKIVLFVVAVGAMMATQAFAGGSQKEPCPPNMSCSENYMIGVPQSGAVMKNTSSVSIPAKKVEEKKWADYTPEEQATYRKKLAEAIKRDKDLTMVFSEKSLSETCYYPTGKVNEWLMKNIDAVVDRKEFLAPSHFKWGKGTPQPTGCMATIVVHYHNVAAAITKEVKKKKSKK